MAWTRSFVLESIREAHGVDGPPEGHPLRGMPAYDPNWHAAHGERLLPRVELVARLENVRRGSGWPEGTDEWIDQASAMAPVEAERFLAQRLNTFVLAVEAADSTIFAGLSDVLETHAYDVTSTGRPRSSGLHPGMVDGWMKSEATASRRQLRLSGLHHAAAFDDGLVSIDAHSDSHHLHRWSRTFDPLGHEPLRKKTAQLVGLAATEHGVYAGYSTEVVLWTPAGAKALSKKTGHLTGKITGLVGDGEGVWAYGAKEAVRLVGSEVERRVSAPAKVAIRRLAVRGDELLIRDLKKLAIVRGGDVTIHPVTPGFDLDLAGGDVILGDQWLPAGASKLEPLQLPEAWGALVAAVEVEGRHWAVFQGGAVAQWQGGLTTARPIGPLPHFVRGAFAVDDALILHGSHFVEWVAS